MIIYEFKVKGKEGQYRAIDEAIRTSQFIQNKALRYWMDNTKISKYDLNKYCAVLAAEYSFADELNSMARQSAAERAWSAISRFYMTAGGEVASPTLAEETCKKKVAGKKGFPKFKKNCHSVEYKKSGSVRFVLSKWSLSKDERQFKK